MFVYISTVYFCIAMLWLFASNKDVYIFERILLITRQVVIKFL